MMTDNINRSDPAKKCYTLSISEEEIEKQLSIIFDPQVYPECEQDHSFKSSFEGVKTSTDNVKQEFKSFSSSDTVTQCLTDDCRECTGSYICNIAKHQLLCNCTCHKNKPGISK